MTLDNILEILFKWYENDLFCAFNLGFAYFSRLQLKNLSCHTLPTVVVQDILRLGYLIVFAVY